ncbi:hypothetical protein OFN97_01405 [Campylobacter sp. VBCF_05 NA6]|uniref:hypothetical protein n=1 Tax=unclassified Campylobacter TaxID=2593542 RepID=UPI0022E9E0FF|nr:MULTISPECIES: hypothetical protein [unclassified Campylobacter]MDA3056910.1 hypothetical protein [Campylobacter sp. VBCF_04 NA7]MDA3058678.1 hypothetical protein [Campylobacter sp. VBCF_05 NA6]MDA3077731.1 hypothetical protein [Campylobacter sp. JMF_06 NA1]
MSQINEKSDRIKYIRALERFAKSAISILKRDDFDENLFKIRVIKNYEVLKKVEAVYLDQPYTKSLENFVKSVLAHKSKDELIKEANLLEKLKNSKTYKKEKHKGKFSDEY